ncbi:unnamed protein product [Larinioides sclopetarius]|uniref:Uncharacterized protein n=1 Tax=Larinioides sclopetarius TaxID=280406 RepID=A0AAV2BN59_9ARAC
MTMKDMHGLECPQCKIRDEFYERFNSDSKKNVSYFGVISYVNNYYVMPVSSDKSKEEFPKNGRNCKGSNICFLQLINEWTVRDLIAKRIKQKNGLLTKHLTEKNELFSERFKQKKRKSGPKPSFYLPEHTGNLITIKKSESFTESSPDDTVCSDNLETTKVVYKCKLTKKSPSKEKVGCSVHLIEDKNCEGSQIYQENIFSAPENSISKRTKNRYTETQKMELGKTQTEGVV